MPVRRLYSIALLAVFLLCSAGGCAMQRAADAEAAQKIMVGMQKEQVFNCMGIPKRKAVQGETEIWEYKSGNDRTDKSKTTLTPSAGRKTYGESAIDSIGASLALGDEVSVKRYCIVQIVMKQERVTALRYSGPTGGFLTDDEQCAFAVRNCLPK